MCATISTSPDVASVTTAVTSPSSPNCGVKTRVSSISELFANFASRFDAGLTLRPAQHRHKAHLLVRVVAECAGELCRHGQCARLLHPAQRHAHMLGLDHYRHAARLQDFV